MPGVSKTGLKITIHHDELVIDGEIEKPDFENSQVFYSEIQHANYHRAFRLADNIDRDKIEASLNQGILKVVLPKREDFRAREIQVKFENE
jgi:HSP20 family molecular chaperone IbpA